MKSIRIYGLAMALLCMTLMTASCGKSDSNTPAVDMTTITGSVYAAPVDGAAVSVQDVSGAVVAGPVTAAADGTFSIDVPTSSLAGDLRFVATGGTFIDEATGTITTAGALAAYVSGGSLATGSVNLDPSSTIVHELATTQSKTFGEAQAIFNSAFGFQPDCSIVSRNVPSTSGTDDERMKAFRAGVFSQLTKDMGLTPDKQFDLLTAIAQDLGNDGKLNGLAASNGITIPEDIQNRFETAVATYVTNTTTNQTGITTGDIGNLPFSTVALTSTYRVEYLPGMMAASQGKTSFSIKVTKLSDGSAATGLTLTLMPMMYMPTMSHATPMDAVTESSTPGTYNCTVYYLMASGSGMGYWKLPVMISSSMGGMGETATFYPSVSMSMSADTGRATLKGVADLITSGTSSTNRSYYLFNDGLTSSMTMGKYDFKLFIAAKESMMSYPSVGVGKTLTNEQNVSWTVATMTVSASTDKSTWIDATEDSIAGHWSITNLAGLSSGQTGTVYVKLTINGEVKTTDGKTAGDTNGYSTFSVTPSSSSM